MIRAVPLILGLTAALVLASCTSGINIDASTSSITIAAGSTDTISATVTGAQEDTMLSVSGLPADVSAQFSPETLAGGSGTSQLTIDVGSSASEGEYELTVTATSAGQQASTSLSLNVTTDSMVVEGFVRGIIGGQPGAGVAIGAKTAVTLADGSFTIAGVSAPYDLVVYSGPSAHVFEGLTSPSPTVMAVSAIQPDHLMTSTIEGTLWATVAADQEAVICVEPLDGTAAGCTRSASGDSFSLSAIMEGASTVDVRVHALLYSLDVDGLPDTYLSYGSADGTISSGGTTTIDPVQGSTPDTATLSGTVNPPGTLVVDEISIGSRISDNLLIPVVSDLNATTPFSYQVPEFSGTHDVLAVARDNPKVSYAWEPSVSVGDSLSMDLPNPGSVVSPADGTTGVDLDTTFEVGGTNAPIFTLAFSEDTGGPEAGRIIAVTTSSNTVTIPDLSLYGLHLPTNTTFIAGVFNHPEISADMNEAAHTWLGNYADFSYGTRGLGPGFGSAGGMGTNSIEFVTE